MHPLPEIVAIIPVAPKDYVKLTVVIRSLHFYSRNPIKKIFVIAPDSRFFDVLPMENGVSISHIPETWFPFLLNDVHTVLKNRGTKHNHASWYYQQLLKFYALHCIDALDTDWLCIFDADCALGMSTVFVDANGCGRFPMGYPFKWGTTTNNSATNIDHTHIDFARRLVPGLEIRIPFSGMLHHMLFHRKVLTQLFALVESHYGIPFWKAFLEQLSLEKWNAGSEYVIFFHFIRERFPSLVYEVSLTTCDIIHDAAAEISTRLFEKWKALSAKNCYSTVGCHGFHDLKKRLTQMDYLEEDLRTQMLSTERLCFLLTIEQGEVKVCAL